VLRGPVRGSNPGTWVTLEAGVVGQIVLGGRLPWIQTEPEMERQKFVQAVLRRDNPKAESCTRFGFIRKTGPINAKEPRGAGSAGLCDTSRAPKSHLNQTPPEQEAAILRVRKSHLTLGSKKVLWKLDRELNNGEWPARSTVKAIQHRAGPARRRW
jgi:hypothetical protein